MRLGDILKGKSKEELLEVTQNYSPERKVFDGIRLCLPELVERGLDEGADPSIDDNKTIYRTIAELLLSAEGMFEIVEMLYRDARVKEKLPKELSKMLKVFLDN